VGDKDNAQPKASTSLPPLPAQLTGNLPVGPTESVTKGGDGVWDRSVRPDYPPRRAERPLKK
jgi:hypothetical protein